MITSFRLKAGRVPGASSDAVATTPITIFVGPNNSGKSKVLTEIEQCCRTGQKLQFSVLEDLDFAGLSSEKAVEELDHLTQPLLLGETLYADHVMIGGNQFGRVQVHREALLQAM